MRAFMYHEGPPGRRACVWQWSGAQPGRNQGVPAQAAAGPPAGRHARPPEPVPKHPGRSACAWPGPSQPSGRALLRVCLRRRALGRAALLPISPGISRSCRQRLHFPSQIHFCYIKDAIGNFTGRAHTCVMRDIPPPFPTAPRSSTPRAPRTPRPALARAARTFCIPLSRGGSGGGEPSSPSARAQPGPALHRCTLRARPCLC